LPVPADIELLGFRTVAGFQRAWNLGPRLTPDGIAGPLTLAAARLSASRHRAGQADLSAHFSAGEASCRCHGRLAGCQGVLVMRELLQVLEMIRHAHGDQPIGIVDMYRCPQYNAQVGGVGDSQHPHGSAADTAASLTVPFVRGLHVVSGIGYGARTGTVQHVDIRHVSGDNPTHSTVLKPAEWSYPGR
jgi:hypothetical protein